MSHCKFLRPPFQKWPIYIKKTILITVLISFSFNKAMSCLYKNLCLGSNKSVLNWTFCQLLHLRKTQLREMIIKCHKQLLLSNECWTFIIQIKWNQMITKILELLKLSFKTVGYQLKFFLQILFITPER